MIGETVQLEYNNQICVGTIVEEMDDRINVQFTYINPSGIPESLLMWTNKSNLI